MCAGPVYTCPTGQRMISLRKHIDEFDTWHLRYESALTAYRTALRAVDSALLPSLGAISARSRTCLEELANAVGQQPSPETLDQSRERLETELLGYRETAEA